MDIPVLKVEQRQDRGKGPARRMRFKGMIPAVCYGKGKEPLSLSVDPEALIDILKSARGLNSLIRLEGAEDRTVFVQEMQRHPVERNLLHVDFLWVDTNQAIERTVPIELVGRAPGIKAGGLLQAARRRLLVEALPAELPDKVQIDVSQMEIGDVVHVADVQMPAGVRVLYDHNFTICAVIAPVVEEKPAEAEAEGVEGAEGEKPEGEAAAAAEKKTEGESK